MGDTNRMAIRAPRDCPGIGGSPIHIVQQHRIEQLQFGNIQESESVVVHPTVLDVSGG